MTVITIEEWAARYAAGETVSAVLDGGEYEYSTIEDEPPTTAPTIAETLQAARGLQAAVDAVIEHVHRWNVETIPNPEGVIGPLRQQGTCACGAERDFTPITDEYAGRSWRTR